MKNINEMSELFLSKYDAFIDRCDELEEKGVWDKDEYGEMEMFFLGDVISDIFHLIGADGEISRGEIDFFRKNFRFDVTDEDLKEMYKLCCDDVCGDFFETQFKENMEFLRGVDQKLLEDYKELLLLICDIIIASDDIVCDVEIEEKKKLIALL